MQIINKLPLKKTYSICIPLSEENFAKTKTLGVEQQDYMTILDSLPLEEDNEGVFYISDVTKTEEYSLLSINYLKHKHINQINTVSDKVDIDDLLLIDAKGLSTEVFTLVWDNKATAHKQHASNNETNMSAYFGYDNEYIENTLKEQLLAIPAMTAIKFRSLPPAIFADNSEEFAKHQSLHSIVDLKSVLTAFVQQFYFGKAFSQPTQQKES